MRRRDVLKLAGAAAMAALMLAPAPGRADPAGLNRREIVLGRVNESIYQTTGEIVATVLRRLGYTVRLVDGTHTRVYDGVGRKGDLDLCVGFWLPQGHAAAWKRQGGSVVELSTLYTGARFSWAVPAYVPADFVRSIPDLAKPEVAARMDKSIHALVPDASITALSEQALKLYGLDKLAYAVVPGPFADWKASLADAEKTGRWAVFPLWQPSFVNRAYPLRYLDDPMGVLDGTNRVVLAAHRGVPQMLRPGVLRTLERMRLTIRDVTDMDYAVNVGGESPEQAAHEWTAVHAAQVNSWFNE